MNKYIKIITLTLCVVLLVGAFSACTKNASNNKTTVSTTESQNKKSNKIDVADAKISENNAIQLVKSYSSEELGLKNKDDYKFLFSSGGVEIAKEKYVQVIAATVNNEDKNAITIDTKGEYYINFDGTKLLVKDMKTGEYKTIKITKDKLKELE